MHVPEGWEIQKLEELCLSTAPITYGVLKPGRYHENGIPLLQIKDLKAGKVLLNDLHCISSELDKEYRRSRIKKNDILISLIGTIGRVARYDYSHEMNIHRNLARIRTEYHEYIFHVLRSDLIQQKIKNKSSGSSQSALNLSTLRGLELLLPPLAEQEKIAEILSTWDRTIEQTERLKTNAEMHKKALMQQLLTGKKRLLDENGERFSEEWKKTKLGGFINEFSRRNKNNKIQTVLSISNRIGFTLPENQFSKRVASQDLSNYKIVKKGMFGYNPSRINVGSLGRLDEQEEGVLSPMYVVFKIDEDFLNSDYLLFWFSSYEARYRIESGAQGSVRETLNFDAMRAFPFKLPPLEEQQKIASVLNTADREIELLTKKIEHLKIEKRALMQQLLTGKRRVKVDG